MNHAPRRAETHTRTARNQTIKQLTTSESCQLVQSQIVNRSITDRLAAS